MPLTTKQIIFFFIFLLSWLLLLLLGDSYLSYVLLGCVSLFLLLFSNELEWQKTNNYKWLILLWLLALLGIGLSSFFSVNLPLSLYFDTKFIFISVLFWFFLLLKKSFISSQQVIKLLLLISLVILVVSTSFQFVSNLANLLPGMNLLHATYGHNHLAALLLLVIPLSWWLASEYVRAGQTQWWWLLPLIFNLGLLFSFGRVAVVIGLVQFLVIFLQLKKNNLLKNRYLSFVFKVLTGLFLIVLLGNTFFSTATLINPEFSCPIPSLKKQLCKSIVTESRPEYWRWAIEIIQDNLWLGSGPGTFSLAAKKYYSDPFSSSAYAHNIFLDSLSEIGLVGGGLFIVLMFSLLYLAWKNLGKRKTWDWRMAVFIGVVSIYFDVLFDFDWEFIGIFSMTIMLLALVMKDSKTKLVKNSFSNFFKIIYFLFVFILISIAGLYLKTDVLIKAGKIQQAFELFPYFHWHRKIYESSSKLSDSSSWRLLEIYYYYPDVYEGFIINSIDKSHKQQLKESLIRIDPWQVLNHDVVSFYLEKKDWEEAGRQLTLIANFFKLAEGKTKEHLVDQKHKSKLAKQMIEVADGFYLDKQLAAAAEWYVNAYEVENWSLDQHKPIFLEDSSPDVEQKLTFFSDLSIIPSKFWGDHRNDYARKYLGVLIEFVQKSDVKDINSTPGKDLLSHQKQILDIAGWLKWEMWDELGIYMQLWIDYLLQEHPAIVIKKAVEVSEIFPDNYLFMSQPANLAVLQGDFDQAGQLYKWCLDNYEPDMNFVHNDCKIGLQSVEEGHPNINRYWEVSEIIRGEAVWQDFTE